MTALSDLILVEGINRSLRIFTVHVVIVRHLRVAQLRLIQIVESLIGLIGRVISTSIRMATSRLLAASVLLLDQAGWVVADVLDSLDLITSTLLPLVDVVVRVLLLEPFQEFLILLSDTGLVLTSSRFIRVRWGQTMGSVRLFLRQRVSWLS